MGMREAFECLKGGWVSVVTALQSFTIFYPSFRSTSTADVPSREFGDFCNGKPELPSLLKSTIQDITGGWAGSHHSSLSKFKAEVEALREALGGWVYSQLVRSENSARVKIMGLDVNMAPAASQARTDWSFLSLSRWAFCGMVGNTPWHHWFEGCDPKTPPAL